MDDNDKSTTWKSTGIDNLSVNSVKSKSYS